MLKNHLRVFLRHLNRHKRYAFINISGLAVGMAACILIVLFIQRELSFEDMHGAADRTYRVLTIDKALGTNNQRVGISMPAMGPALPESFAEVEASLRLTFGGQTLLRYEDRPAIYAEQLRSTDPNFFDFFDYPLLQGDPRTALVEPYSIVLTESLARQLFGDVAPLGKTLRSGSGADLTVTGVMADLPDNTHLAFDALGATATIAAQSSANQPPGSTQPPFLETWQAIAMPTYVKFKPGVSPEGFDERFTQLARDNNVGENFDVHLQPLRDVHLQSADIIFDPVTNKGDIKSVYIFGAIALLTLLIAVVNYMNLATARSLDRAKEVGMRKVLGSDRSQLVRQFLSESLLTTSLALGLAVGLALVARPWLSALSGTPLTLDLNTGLLLAGFLVVLLVVVGILAGLYPAFALASFKPLSVLKGAFRSTKQGRALRVSLVVFQFALSIALIGSTAIIQKQLRYIQTRDVGYQREQVVLFDMLDQNMAESLPVFREALVQHSSIVAAAPSGNVPGRTFGRTRVRPEGVSDEDIWIWSQFGVSPETLPTLGMEMVAGRNFSRERGTDSTGVALVNETAVRQLGWDEPLHKRLYFGPQDSVGTEVVGVVRDFNFANIHQNIEPVVIFPLNTSPGNLLAVRIQAGQIPEALAAAEATWREVYPDYPFAYSFLEEEFNNLYARDRTTGQIVNIFSILAILIAGLGLFGLASHATVQRTKEIGVRKVLGASSPRIIRMLVGDFVRWVALANLIAWPLAWYASERWLDGFAYRIDVDPLLLLLATGIALVVSVLTVLGQSWRAAAMNPARSLRYE